MPLKRMTNKAGGNRGSGVTLVEILTVIVIVGIIAGISFATYENQSWKNHKQRTRRTLETMLNAARQFDAQHPASLSGERTFPDWVRDWKTDYLPHYIAEQPDQNTQGNDRVLKTGLGKYVTEYYFDIVEGNDRYLRIVSSFQDGSWMALSWDGAWEEEDGGGGTGCRADVQCHDNNPCTVDECIIENNVGECSNDPEPNGTACEDGFFCTENDQCTDGVCGGETNACDDGVNCTIDSCDEEYDLCVNAPDNTICDNGAWCDGEETCDPRLGCQPGTAPNCDDSINCTDDTCNEGQDQCDHTPNNGLCDDANDCTTDACDPFSGCTYDPLPDGSACSDNNECTMGDRCLGGLCESPISKICADFNLGDCIQYRCNPGNGNCDPYNVC